MFVYSLFNKKTGVYQDPFIQPIEKKVYASMMQRSVILDPDMARKNHVYECELFFLGKFDEVQGQFELLDKPEFLCTFSNLEVKQDA